MRQASFTITAICFFAFSNYALARNWTDITGSFSVEATLVEVKEGTAFLKKVDGSIIGVPLAKLSTVDREFIESQKGEKAVGAKKSEKAMPIPLVPDNEPKPPAELLAGGKNWKSVKSMIIGEKKWESGAELWIWPDKDDVVRPAEDGKLAITFRCELKPGKKQPDKLVPWIVIFANDKSGGAVTIQGQDPYLKAPEFPTDEPLRTSFSAKDLSGSGTVHFFITSGVPWNIANRPKTPRERMEMEKKILVYSNLIQINCDLGKP